MEKWVIKIYLTVLAAGLLFALFAAISFQDEIYTRKGGQEAQDWNDQMKLDEKDGVYYYRTTLPDKNTDGKVLVYNTVHMYLEVQINGKKVYELKPHKDAGVKTTGFCWNFIQLTEEDAGKEAVFQVTPAYSDSKPKGSFYYGTYREVEHRILGERIFRFVIAGMIALAGIIMLIYGCFVVKKGQDIETILQFALFAIMLGIWSICETQILDLFFPGNIVIVFISHLMLMTMPVPFLLFLRRMYHNGGNILWMLCCYLNCGVMAARLFLQLAGVYDLRETLWLTHIALMLFVVISIGISVHEIVVSKMSRQVRINCIGVLIIMASTVLELGIYRFSNKSTPLGSIGFLIYIVMMGIENVRKSRKLMEQARESEIYRKLAFTDELTGLYNRTAFKQDMDNRTEKDPLTGEDKIQPTVIFMFDLNDLKKCNDTYGHDYGDQYINMAADVIRKVFGLDGRCYRIGGDEFCAWMPHVSLNEINGRLMLMERYVREKNRTKFVVTMSIAAGYAVYKEEKDASLEDTLKRADEMMYERKQAYKKSLQKA